jgi:hypothetical protein
MVNLDPLRPSCGSRFKHALKVTAFASRTSCSIAPSDTDPRLERAIRRVRTRRCLLLGLRSPPRHQGHEALGLPNGLWQGAPSQPALLFALRGMRFQLGRPRDSFAACPRPAATIGTTWPSCRPYRGARSCRRRLPGGAPSAALGRSPKHARLPALCPLTGADLKLPMPLRRPHSACGNLTNRPRANLCSSTPSDPLGRTPPIYRNITWFQCLCASTCMVAAKSSPRSAGASLSRPKRIRRTRLERIRTLPRAGHARVFYRSGRTRQLDGCR